MPVKTIHLCEGHEGGFVLMKIISPRVTYRGTLITKLKVVRASKDDCVQCKLNKRRKVRK